MLPSQRNLWSSIWSFRDQGSEQLASILMATQNKLIFLQFINKCWSMFCSQVESLNALHEGCWTVDWICLVFNRIKVLTKRVGPRSWLRSPLVTLTTWRPTSQSTIASSVSEVKTVVRPIIYHICMSLCLILSWTCESFLQLLKMHASSAQSILVNSSQSLTKPENSVIGWNETITVSQSICKHFVRNLFW